MYHISINVLRQNARQVVDNAGNSYVSPYEEWTSDKLRDLLVQYRIPIRDSANASHKMLVRVCNTVFGAEAAEVEKENVRRYSIEDLVRMDAAVRVIQKAFFRRQALRRQQSQLLAAQHYQQHYDVGCDYVDYDCEDGTEYYYEHAEDEYSRAQQQAILQRITQQGDDYDEETEVAWRKPSWKFAKKFEAMNRSHQSGKQMAPYNSSKVTLGRHCYAGGCWEQLDLWNEGRTSKFSQFGSGVTNYFKVRACAN